MAKSILVTTPEGNAYIVIGVKLVDCHGQIDKNNTLEGILESGTSVTLVTQGNSYLRVCEPLSAELLALREKIVAGLANGINVDLRGK